MGSEYCAALLPSSLLNNVLCWPPTMTLLFFFGRFWMHSPNCLFLSYVEHSPLPPISWIFLIYFSFFLYCLTSMELQYLFDLCTTHCEGYKEMSGGALTSWSSYHSQAGETKLINMTHLANNSLMLRCVRET